RRPVCSPFPYTTLFRSAEAKSAITYLDEDTVLFGTDFGPGSMTASGYPRIVKLWKRGAPQSQARTIYEGRQSDVGAQGVVFHDRSEEHTSELQSPCNLV